MSSPRFSAEPAGAAEASWKLVPLLAVAFAINYADRQAAFAVFPAVQADLGFTDAQLGLAGTLFTWTYSLAMPFTGRLADVFPRGRLIILSIVLWSLATLGTGLSDSVGQFLFWRVMMGITEALYVPAAIGLITSVSSDRTRSRALAIHGAGQVSGIAFGGWFGGWAADRWDWRAGFWLLAVVGLAYSAVLAAQLRNIRLVASSGSRRSHSLSPRALLRSASYLATGLAFFVFCALLWVLYAWLPTFVHERYQLSLAQSGLTATLYLQVSTAVGLLLGGYTGDRVALKCGPGRFYVVAAGLTLSAPLAYLIFRTADLSILKLACSGFGLFSAFAVANLFASIYDVVPHRDYGLATGVLNLLGGLGGGAAMLLAGVLRQSAGFETLMLAAGLSALAASLLLALTVANRFERERQRASALTSCSAPPCQH